ncbi:MAG TPA: MmoB/DmpM family protein [Solirubrobacteraceae bacterium]|nr:MmoB/DmpM family protein [Solirubrobacteraceae bacterium]
MRVRLEPVGLELDCQPGETVLEAAFRQGLNLVHGCREGQCSACKCFLLEGDVQLKAHSSFALSESEERAGYSLMCRAMPERDLVVELLHFDEETLHLEHAIGDHEAVVETVEPLTRDITRLVLAVPDFAFTPGQYVDLHVSGARRSFSMANLPGEGRVELIIKRYPGGRLSGMLDGQIVTGARLTLTGPYGSLRIHESDRPILMVAGGSGMAPILCLLRHLAKTGCRRPVRFFYGARTEADLFALEEIRALSLPDFEFRPVTGRFVHEAVDEWLSDGELDVYLCGPPPMVEATEAVLEEHGVEEGCIFMDKFTTSGDAAAPDGPSERDFTWFTPAGSRATLYEDVTADTQPSVHRHLTRGWPVSFEDGRGTWDEDSTTLRCPDWFAFRDPGEHWERSFYQAGNAAEQQIEGALRGAAREGLLRDFDPEWVEFLRSSLQISAFVSHGLWFATATIARACLSDTVAHCVCLQAALKQRAAQSYVLYAMDLEPHLGSFSIEDARRAFIERPEWQPTRLYLERLAATEDWGEVIVAGNLVFEPLVGTLLRREVGIRAAAAHGDTVTPALARVETQEWEWIRSWSTAFSRFLLPANRDRLIAWAEHWRPLAWEAADAIVASLPFAVDPGQLHEYGQEVLDEAGLGGASAEPARRVREQGVRRTRRAAVAKAAAQPPPDNGPASYDYVGIVMAKSAEGDAVASVLARRDETEVVEQPSFWDIRSPDRLTIPYREVSEQLGYRIDAYSIQHEMSTHYGRMVATDEALILFSDPVEAMQYLMA